MKKALIAIAAAATVAAATVAVPSTADARCRGCAAVGIGAAVLGAAIVGGAIANSAPPPGYAYRGYAPVAEYQPYREYYVAAPVGCPNGYWARRPLHDRYGNFIGWSKPRFFCPY